MPGGTVRRTIAAILPVFGCFLSAGTGLADESGTASVAMFSPLGTARGVRQVAARFSEPMVPVGDSRLSSPFDVSCPAPGKGRWEDSANWIYDFDEELPAGIACRFTVKAGLAALSGIGIGGTREFAFSTGGPAILQSTPYEGNDIGENQEFILVLDAPVDPTSVVSLAYFTVEGIRDRVGIRILSGEEREKVLATRRYARDDALHLVIRAVQAFPPGAKVTLVWDRGIRSASGVATEEDQSVTFTVRGPLATRSSRGTGSGRAAGSDLTVPVRRVSATPPRPPAA